MEPLVFTPFYRQQVWGGQRIKRYFSQPPPENEACGEAWVISAQPLHVSRVCEGPQKGKLLNEIWATDAASMMGPGQIASPDFPLLVKYLDCQDFLSIQVHPNDKISRQLHLGDHGKSEVWIVLEADPDARIYAGLRPGTTRAQLKACLDDGNPTECLHSFHPTKGDCIFLPAGTVHSAGGGLLLAEVQQSSDITFRLFDWNRLGLDGKPRPLHVQEALRCIHGTQGPVHPVVPRMIARRNAGNHGEHLVTCKHFSVDRFQLTTPMDTPHLDRLSVWMVLEGAAELSIASTGYRRFFHVGETVLAPATAKPLRWTPSCEGVTLLATSLAMHPKLTHLPQSTLAPDITVLGFRT